MHFSRHLGLFLGFLGLFSTGVAGCGTVFGPGSTMPLMGEGTLTSQPVPQELAWFRSLKLKGINLEPSFEFTKPAYSPTDSLIWTGSADGQLVCLSVLSGKTVWTAEVGGVRSGITLHGDTVYMGADDGRLIAIDAFTGKRKWEYRVKGVIVKAPVISGKHVLAVDGTNAVYAIEHETGKWAWQYRRDPPRHFAVFGESLPRVTKGTILAGFSDGYLVNLSAADGAVIWTKNLAPEGPKFLDVDGTPVVSGGTVYAASIGGGLYALDLGTGDVKWTMSVFGIVALEEHEDDLLATLDTGALIRIDTYGRKIRWSTQFPSTYGSPNEPQIVGQYVIVNLSKGAMYWVDSATGRPIRQFHSGAGFHAAPAIGKHGIFAVDNAATLFAFRTNVQRFDRRVTPLTNRHD